MRNDVRRNSDDYRPGRHVIDDNCVRTDARAVTDGYCAENRGSGTDDHIVSKCGDAGPSRGFTNRDVLEERAAVADDDPGVDNDSVGMRHVEL